MKTIRFILSTIFACLFLYTGAAQAQNLSFSINRASGDFAILNEKNENVTALYEVHLAEFDIYDESNKYVGTIQVKNNKISPAELAPKENLKVSKIHLKDKETASTIHIDGKKNYKVQLK